MGVAIEVNGETVYVGEPGDCESEIAQLPQNQDIDPQLVGEAVIRSMFNKKGVNDEF